MEETAQQALFPWSAQLNVGVEEIDAQHQELVNLLNALHASISAHQPLDRSRAALNDLADYTRTHFVVEESLMRVFGYPGFGHHKHIHEALMLQIKQLQQSLDAEHTEISPDQLDFLKVWLIQHISEADKRFGEYLVKVGTAQEWSAHVRETMERRTWWWKFW
jgi:hemerythrin